MNMFISPMLLQYSANNEPIDSEDLITQLKLDGIRLLVSNMDDTRIYTKNQEVTARFPELHHPPSPKGTLLDGELIVTDASGAPDFEACMARFQSKKSKHIIQFCAFDILYYKGKDVTRLPLVDRLDLLNDGFEDTEYYHKMRTFQGSSIKLFDIVKAADLEGLVQKKKTSKYESYGIAAPGSRAVRSWSWQKVINYTHSEVFITGYSKKNHSWLIGVMNEKGLKPVGSMKLGISLEHRTKVWPVLRKSAIGENKEFVFVEPTVRCKVKHRAYYRSGFMRLPVLESVIM
jgi:DNA ligase-1